MRTAIIAMLLASTATPALAQDGRLGPTSTGEISITASVRARTAATSYRAEPDGARMCMWSNTATKRYDVQASSPDQAMTATWDDGDGTTTPLAADQPARGLVADAGDPGCAHGTENSRVTAASDAPVTITIIPQ